MTRIGTLGAARIAPTALLKPARDVHGVEVMAVAARDRSKAHAFATKHAIPRVLDSYEQLIADPEIDAIYNPLPNGLHAEWTIAALEAGKHVLCEKPFTANAHEAEAVAAVAARHPELVLMEAFHWRYHPLAERIRGIIASGELGKVRNIETYMCIPLPLPNDIRFDIGLAGGALMDTGCCAIHQLRTFADATGAGEPHVAKAEAKTLHKRPSIDRWIRAELDFENGGDQPAARPHPRVALVGRRSADHRARHRQRGRAALLERDPAARVPPGLDPHRYRPHERARSRQAHHLLAPAGRLSRRPSPATAHTC